MRVENKDHELWAQNARCDSAFSRTTEANAENEPILHWSHPAVRIRDWFDCGRAGCHNLAEPAGAPCQNQSNYDGEENPGQPTQPALLLRRIQRAVRMANSFIVGHHEEASATIALRVKVGRKMGAKPWLQAQNPASASGSEHQIGET
jgi:hypothetical protein